MVAEAARPRNNVIALSPLAAVPLALRLDP